MKKIFLDTNFLIDVVRFKLYLSELDSLVGLHKLVVLQSVLAELEKISRKKTSQSKYAELAKKLAEKFEVEQSVKENADADIVAKADEKTLVATNDRELRKILKNKGIKTIYLRARKHLAID